MHIKGRNREAVLWTDDCGSSLCLQIYTKSLILPNYLNN